MFGTRWFPSQRGRSGGTGLLRWKTFRCERGGTRSRWDSAGWIALRLVAPVRFAMLRFAPKRFAPWRFAPGSIV
jgi:hypothetical protein